MLRIKGRIILEDGYTGYIVTEEDQPGQPANAAPLANGVRQNSPNRGSGLMSGIASAAVSPRTLFSSRGRPGLVRRAVNSYRNRLDDMIRNPVDPFQSGIDRDGESAASEELKKVNKKLDTIADNTMGMGGSGGLLSTLVKLGAAGFGLKTLLDSIDEKFTLSDGSVVDTTTPGTTITNPDGTQTTLEENPFDYTGQNPTGLGGSEAVLANLATGSNGLRATRNSLARAVGQNVPDSIRTNAIRMGGRGVNNAATAVGSRLLSNASDVGPNIPGSKVLGNELAERVAKIAGSKAAKAIPGLVAKSIPFAGAMIGIGEGLWRAFSGDLVGAALSAGSGAFGPATAIPLVGADIAREIYKEVYGVDPEDDPDFNAEKLADIGKIVIGELKKAWDNYGAEEKLMEQTPEQIIKEAVDDGIIQERTNRRGRITGRTIDQEALAEETNADRLQAIVDTGELSFPQQRMLEGRIEEIRATTPAIAPAETIEPAITSPTGDALETMTPDFTSVAPTTINQIDNSTTNNVAGGGGGGSNTGLRVRPSTPTIERHQDSRYASTA